MALATDRRLGDDTTVVACPKTADVGSREGVTLVSYKDTLGLRRQRRWAPRNPRGRAARPHKLAPRRQRTPEHYRALHPCLLFFDEIALLVPHYKRAQPAMMDPELAGALEERHLLRILEPELFVDAQMTTDLAAAMVTLIEAGAFDEHSRQSSFAELSMARAGFVGERETAERVVALLEERGLASPTADGLSIPMHPAVRSTYLVLLAQLARRAGVRSNVDLHPATNKPAAHDVIGRTLELHGMPSRGRVIDFDMQTVAVDLDAVPLDEVLDFRNQHRDEHRRYMSNLRSFCRDVSMIDNEADRDRALEDRRADLHEASQSLKNRAWKSFKRPKTAGGFALGLIGGGISLATGALAPAAVGLSVQLLHLLPDQAEGSVYSYLFAAQRDLWQ